MRLVLGLAILLTVSGCSVIAAPFKVTGDLVEAVPVVGIIGKPVHAVGDVID